jgi:hypothetical protein
MNSSSTVDASQLEVGRLLTTKKRGGQCGRLGNYHGQWPREKASFNLRTLVSDLLGCDRLAWCEETENPIDVGSRWIRRGYLQTDLACMEEGL